MSARMLALSLALALGNPHPAAVAETTSADYEYRWEGLGNKYRDDGFEGYDLEADRGRNQARDRAGEEQRRGDDYRGQASELNGMSNQIGQDRSNLIPRLQQAQAQDRATPNASGSSRVQTLFQQKYAGPKKYEEAYRALGLSRVLENQGHLYHKGPAVQEKLKERAAKLNDLAESSFKQAQQGQAAAAQLQNFQQQARSRKAGMGSLPVAGGNHNSFDLAKRGADLSGKIGKAGAFDSSQSQEPASDITKSNPNVLPAGGRARGIGRSDLKRVPKVITAGDGKDKEKGSNGKPVTHEDARARLLALGSGNFKPLDPIYPGGVAPPTAAAAAAEAALAMANGPAKDGTGRAIASTSGSLESTNAIFENHAAEESRNASEVQILGKSVVPSQFSAFSLDEDSLFTRVRKKHVLAEQSGLIARP